MFEVLIRKKLGIDVKANSPGVAWRAAEPAAAPPLHDRWRARLSSVPARRARVLRHRPSSLGQRSRDSRGKGPTAHDGRQATTSASQMQILPSGLTDRYRPLAIHRWCWLFNPRSMASLDEAFAFSTSTRRCGTSKLKVVLTAQRLVDTWIRSLWYQRAKERPLYSQVGQHFCSIILPCWAS